MHEYLFMIHQSIGLFNFCGLPQRKKYILRKNFTYENWQENFVHVYIVHVTYGSYNNLCTFYSLPYLPYGIKYWRMRNSESVKYNSHQLFVPYGCKLELISLSAVSDSLSPVFCLTPSHLFLEVFFFVCMSLFPSLFLSSLYHSLYLLLFVSFFLSLCFSTSLFYCLAFSLLLNVFVLSLSLNLSFSLSLTLSFSFLLSN